MAYLGKTPSQAVRSRYYFTATGGETSLSGTDDNSNTLTFTDGNYVDVALNGVTLVAGTDYNTTTTNTIGGLTALVASDVIEVIVYDTFSVFSGNVNGDFTVGGTLTAANITNTGNLTFGDNDKAIFGAGSDLQIYHTGADSYIVDAGTGDLYIRASNELRVQDGNQSNFLYAVEGGDLRLYHNGSEKFRTTATGVDVTGAISSNKGSAGTLATFTDGVNSNFVVETSSLLTTIGNGGGSAALALKANNTEAMRINSSGFVGVGESSPQKMLHITKNDSDGMIVLDANGATTDHQICFSKNYGTGGTTGGNYWGIGVDGSENKLVFAYDPNAQASLAADAKVVLDSSGNLLVGGTSLGENGAVTMAGDGRIYAIRASDTAGFFGRTSTDGSIVNFTKDGSTVGSIGNSTTNLLVDSASGSGLFFGASAIAPRLSGSFSDNTIQLGTASYRYTDIYLSGGVYLGGTGSANYLDDYEEGAWTPVLREASRATSVTYGGISAQYIKIGTQVTLTFRIPTSTHDGATSGTLWRIYGFPFTPNSDAGTFTVYNNNSGNLVGYGRMETSTYGAVGIIAIPTTSTLHSTIVYTTNS